MRNYSAQVVVFFGLVAAAISAPWPSSVPICAEECPITDSVKFRYSTDKTYTYKYSGKSQVELKGVDGAVTESHWQKTVLLSWLSPCEMAITFKDVKVDGNAPNSHENTLLTRYPLVVALTDGRVQRVCSHPSDEPWAINLKKGVATAFQNLLPTLSTLSSAVNFTETDLSGRCPTKYVVERQSDKVVVTKQKDHRQCLDQYVTPAETHKIWLKAPVPIERSWITCKQEITNGIYSSITCRDKAILRPSVGAYKHIEANQESTLRFVSENQEAPESLSTIRGEYDYGSLLYDHRPSHKNTAFTTLLEKRLKELCEKTQESIEHESASTMSDIIQVMKRVPDRDFPQVLEKIRQGQICPQKKRLESLYLHAIAYTYDSGSVKIIVDELLKGTSPIHTALYASALYNTHHPDSQSLKELKRLFESDKYLPTVWLSAASMVNSFCRHHQECHRKTEVAEIINVLHSKLQQQCAPSDDDHTKNAAFATLESIGNIGVMTSEMSKSAVKCIETRGVENSIRIAAVRSFRNAKCQRYATLNLVKIAVDHKRNDELRIASYLAAMRCAEKKDVEEMMSKILKEDNTQVRSFVRSHILNIQKSTNPEKKHMKYLLNDFIIPSNYTQDFRRYSHNIDTSFYEPSLGLGGGVETNIIYGPGSFVPRSVALNFTSMLYGQSFNLGQVGTRFEGVDGIIKNIFGPPSILHGTSQDSAMKNNGGSILEKIVRALQKHRIMESTPVGEMLKKIYEEGTSKDPYVELYANIMGQDIAYKIVKGNLRDIEFGKLLNGYISTIKDVFAREINAEEDFSHMTHIALDYFLPTGHGAPLRMKFTGTAILGMKMEGKLNFNQLFSSSSDVENNLKIIPGLSVETNGFIGYDCFLSKTGLQMNNSLSINSGLSVSLKKTADVGYEAHIDLPENMDVIRAQSETYLMKAVAGSHEQVIIPGSVRDDRIKKASCITEWESMLGLKICYNLDVPDIFRNNGLPLGAKSTVKLDFEKTDPSLRGYKVKAAIHNNSGNKELNINVETKGLSTPKKTEAAISYTKHGNSYNVKANVMGPNVKGGFWVTMNNEENQRNLEIFGEYESNVRTLSRGIKIDYKTTPSGSSSSADLTVFASHSRSFPSSSEVFSLQILSKRTNPQVNMAVLMKTHNAMVNIVDLNFQAAFDLESSEHLKIPDLKKIRRLELQLGFARWEMVSYMRHGGESPESREITTAFHLLHRDDEIIKYTGKHLATGSMDRDYSMQNIIDFKLGQSGVKIDQQFFYGVTKIGMVMKMEPLTGSNPLLNFEAMLTNSDREHKLFLLVDIPAMTSPLRLTGRLRPSGEDSAYGLQVSLVHGERKALEVTGPCHIKLQPRDLKIETNLQIKVLNQEPFKWKNTYEFTQEKIELFFDLANQRESLLLVEWRVRTKNIHENQMAFRFDAASFVKHRIDVIVKENQIEISTDNMLVIERPQRIKGNLDVFYAEKKAKLEALWDADQDPNKKLIIDSKLTINPSQPQQYLIVSTVNHKGKIYNAHLELKTDYLTHPTYGDNGLKLTLSNDERKTLILEGGVKRDHRESNYKIDSHLRYKSWEEDDYKFTNFIDKKRSDGKYNFDVRSEFMCKMSQQGESALKVDVRSSTDSTTGRELSTKVITSVPGKRPVDVEFKFVTAKNVFSAKAKSEATSNEFFLWKTSLHERGQGIKSFEVKTDFTGVADLLKNVREILVTQEGSHSSIATYEYRDGRSVYHSGYENFPANRHTLWIHTPDRKIHAEGEVSPTLTNIHVYPDRSTSDEKYDIQLLASVAEGTMDSPDKHQWQGRLRHPHFPRDKMVTLEIANEGAGLKGKLEIDIHPDEADKLTGTVTSTPLTEDSTQIQAVLSARILRGSPVLTAVIAHAPHTVGFDVLFRKASSEPVSFMMAGKYDRSTFKNKAISFEMKSEGKSVISVTAVTKDQMKSQCYGMHIKASAVTSFLGSYNIQADACKPLYIAISANKHGEQKTYIGKFGFENPNKAEISLSTKVKGTIQNNNAFLARLMLTSPTMLKLDLDYKPEETKTLLEYLGEKADSTVTSVQSWMHMLKETLQEAARTKHIQFPSAELTKEWKMIVQEAITIFHDMRDNKLHPAYNKIKNFLNSPSVSYITSVYSRSWMKMAEIQRVFTEEASHKILSVMRVFKEAYSPAFKGLRDLAHMMRTAEVPEFILNLRRKFEESWLYQKVQVELNDLGEKYPTQYKSLQEVWIKLRTELLVDLEKLRVKFLTIPPVVDFINWVTVEVREDHMANIAADRIMARILQETVYVTVETHPGHVGIDIPIREELYSLNQVLQEVWPYPSQIIYNIIWSYDTYITLPIQNIIKIAYSPGIWHLKRYLPPFNGTAMLIGNNEVLTFDGERIRIPKTPCEIKLVHIENTKLTFKHQVHEQHPTVSLTYKDMKVIVQPNFRVILGGREVSEHVEMKGLAIMNTQNDVRITTPVLSVYMVKNLRIVEVQTSGWNFGNVAGILGTFDGERANDLLMPTGVLANEAQQFVTSWQEDHSCRTPALQPVHIPISKMVACHALLGMRSRCNPIVDPYPFIQMCREVENPCDPAKAYRHLCSQRGILEPYPQPC